MYEVRADFNISSPILKIQADSRGFPRFEGIVKIRADLQDSVRFLRSGRVSKVTEDFDDSR